MNDIHKAQLSEFKHSTMPAQGLPASLYRDNDLWEAECRTVLSMNWVCVGYAHELKKIGDAITITVADQPLFLVRNATGNIQAFHNVCRHRCLKLIDEPKNVGKLIRCPYHAWAYDLDGKLRASPYFWGTDNHQPEGFDTDKYGLVPVRTTVWHDWIFVNLNGNAPEFKVYAAALIRRLEGIDFDQVKVIGTLDFGEIETNWKLIMENFIEPYHVQFVHASTTDQPLKDHYTIIDENCFGSAVDLQEETGTTSRRLGVSSRYLTLYPNFIIGRYFPDQVGVYLNIPLGPGKMAQKRALYTTTGKELPADEVEALKKLWWDVHKEDHAMVERMYKGRASNVACSGGVLSPVWEDSVRAFQEKIVSDLMFENLNQENNAMNKENLSSSFRLAHTMMRVLDMEKSLEFYCGTLGMQVLRRTDYPDGKFTNTFIGYGPEAEFPTLELTANWDQSVPYEKGNGWGHICIETPDIYKTCEFLTAKGVTIIRPPGPMKNGTRVIAFCEDPDGYKVELNESILKGTS